MNWSTKMKLISCEKSINPETYKPELVITISVDLFLREEERFFKNTSKDEFALIIGNKFLEIFDECVRENRL